MNRPSTVGKKARMENLGPDEAPEECSAESFHDLDSVMASPMAQWKRSWWVREVDKPTLDIDWDATKRFDATQIQQVSWHKYVGEEKAQELTRRRREKMRQWILEDRPGYTLRDRALDIAGGQSGTVDPTFRGSWADVLAQTAKDRDEQKLSGTIRPKPMSPEELGVPRWEGKPEENSRMIRTALRHYGAHQVGFVELDERTRKLIYSVDSKDGKRIEFENVEQAYETGEKRVIPEKVRWLIVFSIQMSEELIKRKSGPMPDALSSAATGSVYGQARNITDRLQNFLYVLGYQGLKGTWYNGLGIAPAFGVLAGLGELSRLNRMISPEYGPLQRVFVAVTDLPLEPTKPIDAGIMNFCRTCKICAEQCPADCLSKETEPYWEPQGPWNNPGHKTWYEDSPACSTWWAVSTAGCSTCFAVCAFAKKNESVIHDLVKITIAKNRVLPDRVNAFFTKMDGVFGYQDQRVIEEWWDMDMPPRGTKNTVRTLLD
jgi:reductive dehalogenase|tara:strand:+ start:1168 stop:2634 length:1467 start_codon:yes stop_codon:yes gene_type:complete